MKIEDGKDEVRLVLTKDEVRLLRRALERASFQDTPVNEQEEILAFCESALGKLPQPAPAAKRR